MPDFKEFNIALLLLGVQSILFILIVIRYFTRLGKVAFYKSAKINSDFQPPVSVIICARNEGDNLTEFLPKVLTQHYPKFEVIVVNDCSEDNTEDVLREYKEIFPNLRSILIKEDEYYKHGKKFAVMVGIKGAAYEHLLMTDADCYPASDSWISEMMAPYANEKTEIVIGYGPYISSRSLLNKLIRYDTFLIAQNYLSSAIKGKPFMAVGRNLSYKKELFFKHKGFSTHYHIQSGDDDLFINQVANSSNVAVVINPDSNTYSVPAKKFREWFAQKKRHISTAPLYKMETKLNLGYHYLIQYLFNVFCIVNLFFPEIIILSASIALLKYVVQIIIFSRSMKKLNEKELLPLMFLLDLILLFFYPMLQLNKKFKKQNKWKN